MFYTLALYVSVTCLNQKKHLKHKVLDAFKLYIKVSPLFVNYNVFAFFTFSSVKANFKTSLMSVT